MLVGKDWWLDMGIAEERCCDEVGEGVSGVGGGAH